MYTAAGHVLTINGANKTASVRMDGLDLAVLTEEDGRRRLQPWLSRPVRSSPVLSGAVAVIGVPMTAIRSAITDKVIVHGANGDNEIGGSDLVGGKCIDHVDASSFTVKGCNFKMVAHLLTECGKYGKYSQEVGHCDCGSSADSVHTLESGYTEKFEWKAASVEILKCPST